MADTEIDASIIEESINFYNDKSLEDAILNSLSLNDDPESDEGIAIVKSLICEELKLSDDEIEILINSGIFNDSCSSYTQYYEYNDESIKIDTNWLPELQNW